MYIFYALFVINAVLEDKQEVDSYVNVLHIQDFKDIRYIT